MIINAYKQSVLSTDEVINLMLDGKSETGCVLKNADEFNAYNNVYSSRLKVETEYTSVAAAHSEFSSTWFMPEKYHSIDVLDYCLTRVQSDIEQDRVQLEYAMFEERGLIPLLQYFIYLVDTMTDNNIIWGVGRGSSVASYILYVLGIHRIDSIKYNLDITEFLK